MYQLTLYSQGVGTVCVVSLDRAARRNLPSPHPARAGGRPVPAGASVGSRTNERATAACRRWQSFFTVQLQMQIQVQLQFSHRLTGVKPDLT